MITHQKRLIIQSNYVRANYILNEDGLAIIEHRNQENELIPVEDAINRFGERTFVKPFGIINAYIYDSGTKEKTFKVVDNTLLTDKHKPYKCTDCGAVSFMEDNGEIRVGFCDKCCHPLYN